MKATVLLRDIIEALESTSGTIQFYLNVKTGEVLTMSEDELWSTQEDELDEDYSDWDDEFLNNPDALMDSEEFLPLPDVYEIDELSMMENFCDTIEDQTARSALRAGMTKQDVFESFKSAAQQYGLVEKWEQFRENAYRDLAIEWCASNDIPFVEE
jgi:hypothetical protein